MLTVQSLQSTAVVEYELRAGSRQLGIHVEVDWQHRERLLSMGLEGGYIFSPSHAVEGDTSLENILKFIEVAQEQLPTDRRVAA